MADQKDAPLTDSELLDVWAHQPDLLNKLTAPELQRLDVLTRTKKAPVGAARQLVNSAAELIPPAMALGYAAAGAPPQMGYAGGQGIRETIQHLPELPGAIRDVWHNLRNGTPEVVAATQQGLKEGGLPGFLNIFPGVRTARAGVQQVRQGQPIAGATTIGLGALEAATSGTAPTTAAARMITAAPVRSALGIGAGIAGAKATGSVARQTARAMGANEDVQQAAEEAGGVAGGIAAGTAVTHGPTMARTAARRLAQRLLTSDDAERQAAMQWANQNGIPLDVGTVTGNKGVMVMQQGAEHTVGGAIAAKDPRAAQAAAMERQAGQVAASASGQPTSETPLTAGQAIAGALRRSLNSAIGRQRAAYDTVNEILGRPENQSNGQSLSTNITAAKAAAQQLLNELEQGASQLTPAQRQTDPGYTALKSIVQMPDTVGFEQAIETQSALGRLSRSPNIKTRTRGQALAAKAAQLIGDAVDQAMAGAQSGAAELKAALDEGRAATRQKYALVDTQKRLGVDLEDTAKPVQAFEKVTQPGDRSITLLRRMARDSPDQVKTVARALLDEILSEPGVKGSSKWDKLGTETKNLLFGTTGGARAVQNFLNLRRYLAENPNPSGSGYTLEGLRSGIFKNLTSARLIRMLYNPENAQLFIRGAQSVMGPGRSSGKALADGINLITRAVEASMAQPPEEE